jgi:IS5 family transposase
LDEQLAQCLFQDLLFRRFCRLEIDGTVPDSSTFGRFRNALVTHDVWEYLLAEVNRLLEAKHIIITAGRTKHLTFFNTATIARNVQKAAKFLQRFGTPEPMPTR